MRFPPPTWQHALQHSGDVPDGSLENGLSCTSAVMTRLRLYRCNRSRGGAGSVLRSMRRGQSHFRGGNGGLLGRRALVPRKLGQSPCERLRIACLGRQWFTRGRRELLFGLRPCLDRALERPAAGFQRQAAAAFHAAGVAAVLARVATLQPLPVLRFAHRPAAVGHEVGQRAGQVPRLARKRRRLRWRLGRAWVSIWVCRIHDGFSLRSMRLLAVCGRRCFFHSARGMGAVVL